MTGLYSTGVKALCDANEGHMPKTRYTFVNFLTEFYRLPAVFCVAYIQNASLDRILENGDCRITAVALVRVAAITEHISKFIFARFS